MFHYIQFRPDKKEKWQFIDETQIEKQSQNPSYISVLAVDKDVDAVLESGESLEDNVKYRGPMYFDLDCAEDIDAVLDSTRQLIHNLRNMFKIETQFIHCWLSGGKGVHITIPSKIFGVEKASKHLPLIYKKLAQKAGKDLLHLDMNVYSMKRGRLWRCEHVARPGSGTFKVGVTVDELMEMDAQGYADAVAQDRESLTRSEPMSSVSYMQAETAFKDARKEVAKYLKAQKLSHVVPKEQIRALDATPGCIEKLVKEGDCADSTWNQAAMQLAAWISVRYLREEEGQYWSELVEPFLENVQSSSRDEKERRAEMGNQLQRAFSGTTKFSVGALISTIGRGCSACLICRSDIDFDMSGQAAEGALENRYDAKNKIKEDPSGYMAVVGDKNKQVTTFTFEPDYETRTIQENSDDPTNRSESPRLSWTGTLTDWHGHKFYNVELTEEAWASRQALNLAVAGLGSCKVLGTDTEISQTHLAILGWQLQREDDEGIGGIPVIVNTRTCGIHLDKNSSGHYVSTYVEGSKSVQAVTGSKPGLVEAKYKYTGAANTCPKLLETKYPFVEDEELKNTLHHLFRINRPEHIARMVGWMVATFLSEHFVVINNQFPILSVWGSAGAGKTQSTALLLHLTGMDYHSRSQALNIEASTAHPIEGYLTSSVTVPRFIEEVNESHMSKALHNKVLGMFKAVYNRNSISRSAMSAGKVVTQTQRASAPLCYVAEQRANDAALRNRSVEIMLSSLDREAEGRSDHFKQATLHRESLHRAAKAILHCALSISPERLEELRQYNETLIDPKLDERPKHSMTVLLTGLDFLRTSLQTFNVDISDDVDWLKGELIGFLAANSRKIDQEYRRSGLDDMIIQMDMQAAQPLDPAGLIVDDHYHRVGSHLFINLPVCYSRYRRWMRGNGGLMTVNSLEELVNKIEGEAYYMRKTPSDLNEGVDLHVLNLTLLKERGVHLPNFLETNSAD